MRCSASPPGRATDAASANSTPRSSATRRISAARPARGGEAPVVEAVAGRVDVRRDAVVQPDRAQQQHRRRTAVTVGDVRRDVVDVPVQRVGDRRRRTPEARLEVVAAQHHHDEVQRVVRHQGGGEVGAAVAVRSVDVVDVGGAAVETFLDHLVAVAEQSLQPAGPPDVGAEPHVLRVVRGCAVGVGVAEAEDAYGVGVGAHVSAAGPRRARRPDRAGGRSASGGRGRPSELRGLGFAVASPPLIEAITATRAAISSGSRRP